MTTPPSTGIAPPDRPVPAPRGTSGTACSAQKRASFATSAVSLGSTTASGVATLDGAVVLVQQEILTRPEDLVRPEQIA